MGFWPVVENVIKNADILLLILDARMPELSRNTELERKVDRLGKPLILVFNKIDVVSPEALKELKSNYPGAFFVSGTKNLGIGDLRRHIQILGKKMKHPEPKVGVLGYPNLGKSAIINALARRARTLVADMPGTTRGVQWVSAAGLLILDTPGVIPYEDKSNKLILLGSKHPEKTHSPGMVAIDILHLFVKRNKKSLEERYNISISNSTSDYDVLLEIGKKRGYLKKGAEVDETKTAITIIRDWQTGKLIL